MPVIKTSLPDHLIPILDELVRLDGSTRSALLRRLVLAEWRRTQSAVAPETTEQRGIR